MLPLAGVPAVLGDAIERLAGLDPRLASVALLFQLGSLAFRSLAWRNVLAAAFPDRRVPFLDVGGAYVAGAALNSYVPARGGDVAKALLLRTRLPGAAISTIVGSMSVVLLFDALFGATLLVVAGIAGAVPHLPGGGGVASYTSVVGDHLAIALPAALGLGVIAVLAGRRLAGRLRQLCAGIGQGLAILRQPGRYVRTVVLIQVAAWACRIGVVYFLLAAFHLDAGLPVAALAVVVGGLATSVSPTPGGAGTQQVALVAVLHGTATAASAVAFGVVMQLGAALVNTCVGVAGTMLMFRTLRPGAAIRSGLETVRAPDRAG